jgi:DNA-binding protein H-NS
VHSAVGLKTLYIQPSTQICKYSAKDTFQLLNSLHQQLALDHAVEIQKQIAPEKAEVLDAEPKKEPEPEPKERKVTVLNLTEWTWPGQGVSEHQIK